MHKPELKPCPFCDGVAEELNSEDAGLSSVRDGDSMFCWVKCLSCGAETSRHPFPSEMAESAWNTRASTQPPASAGEAEVAKEITALWVKAFNGDDRPNAEIEAEVTAVLTRYTVALTAGNAEIARLIRLLRYAYRCMVKPIPHTKKTDAEFDDIIGEIKTVLRGAWVNINDAPLGAPAMAELGGGRVFMGRVVDNEHGTRELHNAETKTSMWPTEGNIRLLPEPLKWEQG